MSLLAKAKKFWSGAYGRGAEELPRQLILFATSTCNQRCAHCFYADSLNKKDDLTNDEIRGISNELGQIDTVLFSGGEPFLKRDLAVVAQMFYEKNGTRKFSIPTNATKGDWVVEGLTDMRRRCPDAIVDIYFSFDGMAETHNRIRDFPNAFELSMNNCRRILDHFREDDRFRFEVASTVMDRNVDELKALTEHVNKRFDERLGVAFSFLRGEPKDKTLRLPPPRELYELHRNTSSRYARGGFLANVILKAMLEVKITIIKKQRQIFQCVGGDLIGVIYANGDVSSCEILPPIGNVKRDGGFRAVWTSPAAQEQKRSIKQRECSCTHECFITPSLLYNRAGPLLLAYYYLRAQAKALYYRMSGPRPNARYMPPPA